MGEGPIDRIYELLENIEMTSENRQIIAEIRECLDNGDYKEALEKIRWITSTKAQEDDEIEEDDDNQEILEGENEDESEDGIYPKALSNLALEHLYIGMLLSNPKLIMKYYFTFNECYFEDDMALNNYKSVLFTEGAKYTPEKAKQGFNFAKETRRIT